MNAPMKLVTSLLAVAALAVLVGAASKRQAAPAARWQYRYESGGDLSDTTRLNAIGREGWELVAITFIGTVNRATAAYFKRPLP